MRRPVFNNVLLKIHTDFNRSADSRPLALSIGMFDGVHRGHQAILERLNDVAAQQNLETGIISFWPHPRTVFQPDEALHLLTTLEEKQELLQKNGLHHLFLKSFDEDFRNLSGEEFVRQVLVDKLKVRHLIVGYDHTFGKNKSGNFQLLQELGPELGFTVEQVPVVDFGELHISSTQIRNALFSKEVQLANDMLGYTYALTGTVVHGRKIGRTIGYPTANLEVDPMKLLPGKGAYIVETELDGKLYKGMLSIGTNPTVNGKQVTVEVYILDFDGVIYGKTVTVRFRAFLHEEIAFTTMEDLILKLDEDKRLTEAFSF